MKRNLLFILMMLVSMMGTRNAVNAQNLTSSDVQNSGCLRGNQRRANENETQRTIVLLKEGNILSVQILGFVSNCATMGFDITPSISGGSDGTPCSVSVQVEPIYEEEADCICPFNVSFTLHGLEANSFYFSCWWYEGQVSLTEGEPMTLESITVPVHTDEWYYIIDKVNHTAIVEGVDGGTSELLIPWVVAYEGSESYIVTGIDEEAFINHKALASVTLPPYLTHIGDYAFAGCDNLTDVYCYAENAPITGSDVFYRTPIASATLHVPAGSVEKYKATAPWNEFGNIVGEGRVIIDGLNYYLNSSTYTALLTEGNTWEGELDIPTEVSFYGQAYVVTSMDWKAFYDCPELTKVRIPKSLEFFTRGYYTTNPYEDVEFSYIISDCMNPFIGCTALESIEVDEENPSLKSIDGVLFSQDGKGQYHHLTSFSYSGTGLYCYPAGARRESYTIPDGVEWIGTKAFEHNQYLSSLTMPSSLTQICVSAFSYCNNLTDIYCYAEDVPVVSSALNGFPIASATLHVPASSVEKYKATAPWNEFGNIVGEGEVTIDGLNYYLNSSFYTAPLTKGNTWEGELDIPSEISFYGQTYRVTSMDRNAFCDNTKLTKVRIPKSLESILRGYYTTNPYEDIPNGLVSSDHMNPFRGCTALESIEVDEENPSLKSVDGVLFSQDGKGYYYYLTNSYYGTGLYCYPAGARRESYTIPNGVEWIGSGAFGHNQYISTLTIPSSLKQICNNVFAGCNNLKDIYCYAENVPITFSEAFKDFPIASATLHVPAGSVEKYKATSPWSSFGNIVAIEEIAQEYFPEGTKWTEIRLDTLKYNNWYSKVGDEWVPNFETIEYRVQGEYGKASDNYWNAPYKCVYTNSAEWTDSLTLLISEGEFNGHPTGVLATIYDNDTDRPLWPSSYSIEWEVGTMIRFKCILSANATALFPHDLFDFGIVEEIKEGDFGGVGPLKYSDVKGVRIIQGIGVATWNDGECIFGPLEPYEALSLPHKEVRHYRSMLVHFERDGEVLYNVWPEKPHQPLPFLEGNPIWEYKYEHIPTPLSDDWMKCWVDTGDRSFTYYFLGGLKEIDGKTYTMMGEIVSRGEDITFNRWYPVREENGIVYTITDSLPGVVEHVYNDDYEIPYLQEGNECILYNFGAEIGDKLDKNNVVKSFDTYQLMDGTECRVLKTGTHYDLYEKIGYRDDYGTSGLMDPLDGIIIATNGHAYVNRLIAYFQDNKMLYKTPDAREGLCIDDTIWSREDAYEYARSYKVDPRREEVFAYIQQLQKVTAWEVNIDGLSYLLDPDKHEAIISNGNKCSGELDMPSEVVYEGQTFVTKSMLWNAFYNCTGLTKVRIPKTIETVIHYYPGSILEEPTSVTMLKASDYMNIFRGCLSLEAIEVDVDNPIMCSDNGVLFSKDKTCLYCYPAGISRESFTIPETVTRIGAYAISNNKCLVSLTIPGSVTQIRGYTIMYCLALTDVYYPSEEVPVTSRFAFAGSNIPHATLHVPAGSVDAYKSTAPWDFFGNIVALQNPVAFTAGQMATIILPTEPDASKGKYYRLDRVEDGQIVFEQELQPRAHVPYIIVPSEDFSIDPSTLDLEGCYRDTVSVDGISFIGSFISDALDYQEGSYIDFIDTTPDCRFEESCVIGALRAYLLVHWDDPYNQGGTKVPPLNKLEIVLRDYGTGVDNVSHNPDVNHAVFDLQGRRVASPRKGIYIKDGEKTVVN